ncbi:MAG: hypothetical protein SOT41_01255 [Candidatus Faecisoma sp.]|nr:hypothetical protein [Acholeplasma sp.]MDY2892396.1 hypothetical protein [Candidatus Faecisoma sp.]
MGTEVVSEELALLQAIDYKLEFIISFILFLFVILVFYFFFRFLGKCIG